jgi:GntR family transcriptional regulator
MRTGGALNRFSDVPLHRQLADLLEARVRSGELVADERLPGETELAEQHGVHRLTVRQALAALAQRGLIRTVHGRGSFVLAPPIRHEISGDREASLTRAMRESGRAVRQALLQSLRDDDAVARDALRTRGHLRRFDLLRWVDERPWTLTRMWLPERRFGDLETHWSGDGSLYEALEAAYGVRMRREGRTMWCEPAGPVDGEHLMLPLGAPVFVMRGVNVAQDGAPVALVEHRGRGDRVQVTVSFR